MQPQSAQNIYVPQNAANNSTGRASQPAAANIYRQNPSNPAQRSRFVHPGALYSAVHQGVVLGQFATPYAARTPQIPQCQYSPQFYQHMYYPYYLQQPPQQQRATVNSGVGVGLSNAMTLQPGGSVNGPTASGNQGQIPLGVTSATANTVLGVANTTSTQPVGVAPIVSMPHQPPPQQQPQNPLPTRTKLRSHALQIIHPITQRNILDELDIEKNESVNISVAPLTISSTSKAIPIIDGSLDMEIDSSSTPSSSSIKPGVKLPEVLTDVAQHTEPSTHQAGENTISLVERHFKDGTQQRTPIVSAMTDAPSVEIFPTQPQKQRTKKSQNASVIKHEQHILQGKTEENLNQVTDVLTKTSTASSNSVHESLPNHYINQQVPPEEEFKDKTQEETIIVQSSMQISNDEKEQEENCTKVVGVGEEKTTADIQKTKTVKIMQQEEKNNLPLPQHKDINIVNYNEQQLKQEQQENPTSNVKNGNNITPASALTETTENILNNNDLVNNNNNKKANNTNKNNFPKNVTTPIKGEVKLDKNNDNFIIKAPKTSGSVSTSENETIQTRTSSSCSNNSTTMKAETHDEIDKAFISTKDVSENEQIVLDSSSAKLTSTISIRNGKTEAEPESETRNFESYEEAKKNEEDVGVTNPSETDDVDTNKQPFQLLIEYHEGQWSPLNPTGKKQYNKDQLIKLREAKASNEYTEVKTLAIVPQPILMPAFTYRGNKKGQSMVGSFGGTRGSTSGDGNFQYYMKQSSMSGRGGGDNSGHHNRNSGKAIIHLNLSLNQDVKLNEADNAWRPRVQVKSNDPQVDSDDKTQREKDDLIRRVRGILNKLTPERFEPLMEEIIKLKIDTMDKVEAVMILVFEKAIDEPNFSVSYARFCQRLITEVKARDERMESGTKSNLTLFRSALLDKTEQEFTENVTKSSAKEEKLQPLRDKINSCKDENERIELKALLDEEDRKIRRRSGGTVRFIGELFKISILTGKIIFTCIDALLKDPNNEDMLECLCKLLTTVGQKFEQTNVGKEEKRKYTLETVINRMQSIASKNENSKISSRVRFMLQDVIDLRKKKWQSTRNEAPKTMEQIEKEANNEQLNTTYHYMSSLPSGVAPNKRDDRGNRNDGRNYVGSHSQRGDTGSLKRQQGGIGSSHSQSANSNNDDAWHVQTGKGNRSLVVDSSKLVGMAAVDMNNKKMGGAALFQWNNASPQPTSTPSNSFAALSLDSNRGSDRDQDRDRGNPRNKGSYNKGSMERDRYDHDRLLSRTGSSQASRENSSSRGNQGVRGITSGNPSNMQKSSSHSKYQQPMSSSSSLSRITSSKMPGMSSGPGGGGTLGSSLYRDSQQQQAHFPASNAPHQQQPQQNYNVAASETTKPLSAPSATFEEPTSADIKLIRSVVMDMVESAANSKCIDSTTVFSIKKLKEKQLCGLLYYVLTDYLHLANVGPMCRRHLANVVAFLIENNYISEEHFRLAYTHFTELANVLIVDIPELWLYIFEFCGPLIVKRIITVNDLWSSELRESGDSRFSQKFLKSCLQYCTREVGPSFTRNMWKKNNLNWTSFMDENEVEPFIQTNKFLYVENEDSQPAFDSKESKEKRNTRVTEHIEQLLKEGSNADNIIDYINGNMAKVDKKFIKSLTTILTSFVIKDSNSYNLDIPCFQKVCIPVLLRYLDSKEDLELECLYAIQLLVNTLEHPRGLLAAIFGELNDADVIPQESFIAWRDSKDQSAGKGVAVKALNPFFNQVINGETSDDN